MRRVDQLIRYMEILSPAQIVHQALARRIQNFEANLEEGEEISVILAGAPAEFHVTQFGCHDSLIFFTGENNSGDLIELLMHHSQVSLTLHSQRAEDGQPRRIGFHPPGDAG